MPGWELALDPLPSRGLAKPENYDVATLPLPNQTGLYNLMATYPMLYLKASPIPRLCWPNHGGGAPGPDPLRQLPPPFLLVFGWEVLDHGRQRRPKELLPELVEGEKMGFHPICLHSKYSVFSGEPNHG